MTSCKTNIVNTEIHVFEFKLFKYLFDPIQNHFVSIKFHIQAQQSHIHKVFTRGLSVNEILFQRKIFGYCDLDINIDSAFKVFLKEITDPFYVFQVFSVALWFSNNYWKYATAIVVTTIVSLGISVWETRVNLLSIQKMAKYSCPVTVYRLNEKGEKVQAQLSSRELVPGDLFELPEDGLALPCDLILVSGTAIMNEAMLTGESTPIIKSFIPNVNENFDPVNGKKWILFGGTKIVQKRAQIGSKVLGVVITTGFKTEKGKK